MNSKPERPLPVVTPKMRPFWDGALEGRFRVQHCRSCETFHFPAKDFCSKCLAKDLTWVDAKGTGEVFSFVVMHQVYHPYFADRIPYAVVDVKLAEGPHVTAALAGVEPSDIRIGEAVRVDFEPARDGIALPVFRRVAA